MSTTFLQNPFQKFSMLRSLKILLSQEEYHTSLAYRRSSVGILFVKKKNIWRVCYIQKNFAGLPFIKYHCLIFVQKNFCSFSVNGRPSVGLLCIKVHIYAFCILVLLYKTSSVVLRYIKYLLYVLCIYRRSYVGPLCQLAPFLQTFPIPFAGNFYTPLFVAQGLEHLCSQNPFFGILSTVCLRESRG